MFDIRAAVVGAGFIGPAHVEGLRRAGVGVTGILGVSHDETVRATRSLGLDKAYRSFDEILADPGAQTIHIAVPNRLHYDMARRSLEAGKHVLCEKPLAMTSRESAELVEIARRHPKLAAGVNYNIRFYPLSIEARSRVISGDVGEIYHVSGSYVQDWLLYPTDYNWRVLAEEGGPLRAVADIGTHWLDLIQFVTGLEIHSVLADLHTVHPVRQRPKGEVETFQSEARRPSETEAVRISTEDYGSVLIRFAGGEHGCLSVSQVTAGRKNCLRYEIAGSRASLAWSSERPNELWIGHRDRPNEKLLRDPALMADAARAFATYPGGHNEGFPDTFKQCFRAFYGTIARGDFSSPPSYPTFAEAHREIAVCEAVLESHREGGWVRVEA